MSGNNNNSPSIELVIGAATLLLATTSHLFGSTKLTVISLVIGGVGFGILLGARALS
ncbi:MAG TPA: hypothetical protein VFT79_05040 [Solirubrobacterales bacterium]|nr:hypothetical protein [Solirubrobacterales bacterium]